MTSNSRLPIAVARHIIQRVGETGQPPEIGIEHLVVGYDSILGVLEVEYMDLIAELGRTSAFKLIQAYYGGGKTTFLHAARKRAWDRGLCSAIVGLSPDACPFDDPKKIYQAVARELSWPPIEDDVVPSRGIDSSLRIAIDGLRERMDDAELRDWLNNSFRRLSIDSLPFRRAVRLFAHAYIDGDMDIEDQCAAWLRGDELPAKQRAALGLTETVTKANGMRMLRSLCQCLRGLGSAGLLLCFDEMDRNLSLPRRRRRAVAENLKELIDLCGQEALPGLLCLYAVPPEFMREYATEYPALQQRLEGPRNLSMRSPQAAIIDLEELDSAPLELLTQIGERLLFIFQVARQLTLDETLQMNNIRLLAAEVLRGSFDVKHRRQFCKAVVDLLHQQVDNEQAVTELELNLLVGHEAPVVSLKDFQEF